MTEISIDQYVNLDERFASYDNDGYYIDSIMIPIMVADNLPYNLSFSELKEFVKQVEVSIHQEELNHFLEQKKKAEFSPLAKKLESIEKIKEMASLLLELRYSKDSSTLEYFKNYLEK